MGFPLIPDMYYEAVAYKKAVRKALLKERKSWTATLVEAKADYDERPDEYHESELAGVEATLSVVNRLLKIK